MWNVPSASVDAQNRLKSDVDSADAYRWRELYRCENLLQARAVATSIAAMEFDVRLTTLGPLELEHENNVDKPHSSTSSAADESLADVPDDLPGPYVVEVPELHWPDLAEVLSEIIAEQAEFDEWLELRRHRRSAQFFVVLGATGVVHGLAIWQLLDP